MTPEEVYAALAVGKKVEYNRPSWDSNEWVSYNPIKQLDMHSTFRLAPTIIKYRKYFYRNVKGIGISAFTPTTAFNPIEDIEKSDSFISWIDDNWVEQECPV